MSSAASHLQAFRRFGLDWLLHPVQAAEFFRCHWEAEPLLLSRDRPHYFDDLPGLAAVDELITATVPGRARSANDQRLVKMETAGKASEQAIRRGADGIPDIQEIYAEAAAAMSSGLVVVQRVRLLDRACPRR